MLDENVVLSEIREDESALWSFLDDDALGRAVHRLSIPNREVRHAYATTFGSWMESRARAGLSGALESGVR
jgi:hypothetical protein